MTDTIYLQINTVQCRMDSGVGGRHWIVFFLRRRFLVLSLSPPPSPDSEHWTESQEVGLPVQVLEGAAP